MGRTPLLGFLNGVNLLRESAVAAQAGTLPEATRRSTSCSEVKAAGAASTQRQCSQRAPPRAAPLPRGVPRSTFFTSCREKSASLAGPAVSAADGARGSKAAASCG